MIGALALLAGVAHAAVPTSDFARTDVFDRVSISPDGRYVALRVPMGRDFGLAVLDLSGKSPGAKLTAGQGQSIYDYGWAGDNRLVFTLAENFGFEEAPWLTGEVFAIDADGSNGRYIFGYQGGKDYQPTRLGKKSLVMAYGELIRTIPDDPKHVLVAAYAWSSSNADRWHGVATRVNTLNGTRDKEVGAPINGWVRFAADDTGFVRFVSGTTEGNKRVAYVRTPEQPEWRLLGDIGLADIGSQSLLTQFSPDKKLLYLIGPTGSSDRSCLFSLDLETGAEVELSCDDIASVYSVIPAFDTPIPAAVLYQGRKPRLHVLEPNSKSGKVLQTLQKAFPGQLAIPVSKTKDGQKLVVNVYSDKNPGDFYLVNVATMKADYLASARQWMDPEQMGERRPVEVAARDGKKLYGFLTVPPGKDPKNLPLVTLPHGGPVGIADIWAWDEDAQLLASYGYAVLQINFRGSGGFGRDFYDAGRRAWDTTMIDDITDATKWAIAQGYADPRRVCIYGASYGGYAALMSAEREPDLYRCAIGYAGAYDLPKLRADTDFTETTRGSNYFAEFIGDDRQRLVAASPVSHVDKLKAAVMIVHGTRDERAPFSQAESLRDALKARQYPFEWMEVSGEGHGFYSPENRKQFYDRLLTFLGQNIGQSK
jgi:dipeptidyl aminopeptidase/acylaminoacyl peptidase